MCPTRRCQMSNPNLEVLQNTTSIISERTSPQPTTRISLRFGSANYCTHLHLKRTRCFTSGLRSFRVAKRGLKRLERASHGILRHLNRSIHSARSTICHACTTLQWQRTISSPVRSQTPAHRPHSAARPIFPLPRMRVVLQHRMRYSEMGLRDQTGLRDP